MGVTAAVITEPALYTFEGEDYKVSPWTFEIQGAYERYLENQAIAAYDKLAAKLAPEEAEKALASLHRDLTNGAYTFGTDNVSKSLQSPVNVRYMFFLCLKFHQPKVTLDLVKRMAQADYRGLIRAMNLANTDPNKRQPSPEDSAEESQEATGSSTMSSPTGTAA